MISAVSLDNPLEILLWLVVLVVVIAVVIAVVIWALRTLGILK
jgi:hypothetical protein